VRLRHARIWLELHERRRGDGAALLLLHGLGGSARDFGPAFDVWRGPVYALDFSGHGASERLRGDAYYPELLAADADAALAEIGSAALAGVGLGAYVALLLAGARSERVPGALLLPGAGLDGGGAAPDPGAPEGLAHALAEGDAALREALGSDLRPPGYAAELAGAARRLLLLEDGAPRPPWWEAVRGRAAPVASLADGLVRLAAAVSRAGRTDSR
jgi:pimeloyl-ACP methyl ester carboxylesterase